MEKTTSFPSFIWHYTCVPGEIGIRRSKDLRAGLRKYLRPTNERKQMSTKTLRKRIALVAVSALTAGVISVVSAPVANAAAPTVEVLHLGTTASSTGVAVKSSTEVNNLRSLGLISNSAASVTAGATATGRILGTAALAFASDSATKVAISVSGGTIASAAVENGGAFNGDATAYATTTTGDQVSVEIRPTAGVTSMVVSAYTGAGVTTAAPTNGVLAGIFTFTVVSSSLAGAYDAGESSVYQQAAKAKGTACSGTSAFDTVASVGNGRVGCIWINPKDAYGTAVTAGSLTASATNGAKVAIGASPTGAEGYTASTSFASATSAANTYVSVVQGTANTGGSTVVTIAWQGVVIGTKTITFQGDIAKLTFVAANSKTVYKNGSTNAAADGGRLAIAYVATDALGQAVDLAAGPTISDATGAMTPAVLDNTNDGAIGLLQTAALGGGASAMTIASNSLFGAGTFRLKVTNAAGTDIKSDVINATVSGGAATFTATWNKASYASGEIAELTITAKDSGGRPVAQGVAFGTNAAITINTDGFGSLVTACDTLSTATVVGTDGSRVCKYAVKNIAGSYSYSVAVPTSTSQSAIAGTLKIAADASAVSNADVLKSIVALIASINKQIRALQKLILKR